MHVLCLSAEANYQLLRYRTLVLTSPLPELLLFYVACRYAFQVTLSSTFSSTLQPCQASIGNQVAVLPLPSRATIAFTCYFRLLPR